MPEVTPRPKSRKRAKPNPARRLRRNCDDLWRAIIHARKVCELAGEGDCGGRLEAAHIIPRGRSGTRTDETNGRLLCAEHHAECHRVDGAHRALADRVAPGEYERLQAKAESWTRDRPNPTVFWREEKARLTDLKQRLEGL